MSPRIPRLNTLRAAVLSSLLWTSAALFAWEQPAPEALERKVGDILGRLTLEEKVALCSGDNATFRGIPRLGIDAVRCVDGPRGPNGGRQTTAFPTGVAFGATWNPGLVREAGRVMGVETRSMGYGMLLGPGINILRDPLGGRFFEYYSEDPHLTAELAVAIVRGIQSEGVAACVKHYAANNREDNRNHYMSMVDERTLHEIYLPAFRRSVQEGGAWAIMTSANGVNGDFVSDSRALLRDVLKDGWGFDGFVLTDWLETRSTEKAAFAGLDVSMPGRNSLFGAPLLAAVRDGRVPESVIDDKVRRILRVYGRVGALDGRKIDEGAARNTPVHQAVARKIAEESMVLLKNDGGLLPLDPARLKNVLVVGPNADKRLCVAGYGGSSWVEGPYEISPLRGIRAVLGDRVRHLSTEALGGFHRIPVDTMVPVDGERGFRADYTGRDGAKVSAVVPGLNFMWEMRGPDPRIAPEGFKAVFTGRIDPPQDGIYRLRLRAGGVASIFDVETHQRIAAVHSGAGLGSDVVAVQLQKGRPFPFRVTYERLPGDAWLDVEWETPSAAPDSWARLDEAAKAADAVVFVGGLDHGVDTEGRDRPDMAFPAVQQAMIRRLADANPNTVVVLINGSPLELGGWIDRIPSVIEAWYPGMEGGNALADVIFGRVNPSGKLPFTWPKRLADSASHALATQSTDRVDYTEGLLVGYRYHDARKVEPQFAFGHGLSYTTFAYENLRLRADGDDVRVTLTVRNTGERDGSETVQLYVEPERSSVERPLRELKAFRKLALKRGEAAEVAFTLGRDAFSHYDPSSRAWVKHVGSCAIHAGTSSGDLRVSAKVSLR